MVSNTKAKNAKTASKITESISGIGQRVIILPKDEIPIPFTIKTNYDRMPKV
jgi:hypothetical protein